MQQLNSKKKRRPFESYAISQCALFKSSSPKKLCEILHRSESSINTILADNKRYREFLAPEEINPFSGKLTKARNVQTPVDTLRGIHERLLKLLERIQHPDYAHAGVKKRSYRSNALVHQYSRVIATFDLKDFYGSTNSSLVFNFFNDDMKCAGDVSSLLTKLTTYDGRIPTGSPLSPLLALHAAKPMFDKLNTLASKFNLKFTCYVDDLTFSGDKIPSILLQQVRSIVTRYGYKLSDKKTRIYQEHHKKIVTGTVIFGKKITVPNSRFMSARRLQEAIDGTYDSHGFTEAQLAAKLAGVMNEASYLDPRFHAKALDARKRLAKVKLIDLEK